MTVAILVHGASGLFSVFAKYSMIVQQNKRQLVWHWEWRQLSQNFSGLFGKKIGWGNKISGYIYTEITQIFGMFSHRCRAYLKPSANFANILGKSSSRILAYRSFHLNSEEKFAILFHWFSSFRHQITVIKPSL